MVAKIALLRNHYLFGPLKIAMCLKRFCGIKIPSLGVWRMRERLSMSWLLANQCNMKRWKCYEMPQPRHKVLIDVRFIAPIEGVTAIRHHHFNAIDDCTRIHLQRVYPKCDQKTTIGFFDPRPGVASSQSRVRTDRQRR